MVERYYMNFNGENTTSAITNLTQAEASRINNGDLTNTGSILKRGGYTPINGVAWNDNKVRLIKEYITDGIKQLIAFGVSANGVSGSIASLSGTPYTSSSFFNEVISLTSIDRPSFVQFQDQFFIFNGADDSYWNGSVSTQIGITSPSGTCSLGQTASGGYLGDGNYIVGYTYRNSTTGAESNFYSTFEDIDLTGGGDSQVIDVTDIIPGDADTADQIRIYRTISEGNQLFYEKDLAITATSTTLGDTEEASDDNIIVNVLAEFDNDRPPLSNIAKDIGNRIFLVDGNNIRFSKLSLQHGAMPQSFPEENFFEADPDDADIPVGISESNGIPLIWKQRSFGRAVQTGNNTYVYKKIADVGALSHHALINKDQNVVWVSKSNIHETDGNSEIKVADTEESTIKNYNFISGGNFSGILIGEKQQVKFAVCNDLGQATNEADTVLVGDFKARPTRTQNMSWTTYEPFGTEYPAMQCASFGSRLNDDNRAEIEYLFGNSIGNGFVYRMDYGNDDVESWDSTRAIYFEYISRWIDFGLDANKLFKYIVTKFNALGGGTDSLFIGGQYDFRDTVYSLDNVQYAETNNLWADEITATALWGENLWAMVSPVEKNTYMQKKGTQFRLIYRVATTGLQFELLGFSVYAGRCQFK